MHTSQSCILCFSGPDILLIRLRTNTSDGKQNEEYDAEDFSEDHGETLSRSIDIKHAAGRRLAKYHVVTLEQRHREVFQLILPQLSTVKRIPYALAFFE